MGECKVVTWVCAASAVWIGLAGCVYSTQSRASGWLVVETRHIQLRTNIDRGAAVRFAREMQSSYEVLARHALPCAPRGDQDRVQVTVLPYWQFAEIAGSGAGGFYLRAGVTWLADHGGQIVLPDDLGPRSRQFFQHEMTHRLVESCFVRPPAWLNEGLAGFFETMLVESDRVTIGRPPYVIKTAGPRTPRSVMVGGQRIWIVSLNTLPSIDSVFGLTGLLAHDWRESPPRYATAWALVHFLALGAPDLNPRFEAYLSALQAAGSDPQRLFAKLFEDVPLQDRLNEYLSRGSFDLLQSTHPFVEPGEAGSGPRVRDMPEDEAHVHLAWLGARAGDPGSRERFVRHVAAAKQNPRTRAAAHLVAAYARLSNRDLAGAEGEVQAGLRGAPDSPALLEAELDVLLARKAGAGELAMAAGRLRPVARTAGAVCSLALAALRTGDRASATELAERGLQLDPRGIGCRDVGELAAARTR